MFLILILTVSPSSTTLAQETLPKNYRGPILQIIGGDTVDFGEISTFRGLIEDTLSVANLGNDTLWFFRLNSSAGNVLVHALQKFIPPHDTVKSIVVLMDVRKSIGQIRKSFWVYTNDTSRNSQGQHTVRLHCIVSVEVKIWWDQPKDFINPILFIDSPPPDTTVIRYLHIKNVGSSTLMFDSVTSLSSSSLFVETSLQESKWSLEPGEEKEVQVSIRLEGEQIREDINSGAVLYIPVALHPPHFTSFFASINVRNR